MSWRDELANHERLCRFGPTARRDARWAQDEPLTQKRPRVLHGTDRIGRARWHAARYDEARLASRVAPVEKGTVERDLLYYCCLHS